MLDLPQCHGLCGYHKIKYFLNVLSLFISFFIYKFIYFLWLIKSSKFLSLFKENVPEVSEKLW